MVEQTCKILNEKIAKNWTALKYDKSLEFKTMAESSETVPEYTYTTSGGKHKIEFFVDDMPVRKDTDIVKILADIKDNFASCTKYNFTVQKTAGIKSRIILILE